MMLCVCTYVHVQAEEEGCSMCAGLVLRFNVNVKVSSQSGSQSLSTCQHVSGTDSLASLGMCQAVCVHACVCRGETV